MHVITGPGRGISCSCRQGNSQVQQLHQQGHGVLDPLKLEDIEPVTPSTMAMLHALVSAICMINLICRRGQAHGPWSNYRGGHFEGGPLCARFSRNSHALNAWDDQLTRNRPASLIR